VLRNFLSRSKKSAFVRVIESNLLPHCLRETNVLDHLDKKGGEANASAHLVIVLTVSPGMYLKILALSLYSDGI
jgi:hypothetical protein